MIHGYSLHFTSLQAMVSKESSGSNSVFAVEACSCTRLEHRSPQSVHPKNIMQGAEFKTRCNQIQSRGRPYRDGLYSDPAQRLKQKNIAVPLSLCASISFLERRHTIPYILSHLHLQGVCVFRSWHRPPNQLTVFQSGRAK